MPVLTQDFIMQEVAVVRERLDQVEQEGLVLRLRTQGRQ
tara:strand:- start:329 stop:445 length:117 start_codon:yes stop_codon:yes gene_type:complete